MTELSPHLTFTFWLGAMLLISACFAIGVTYAVFFSDRTFSFGMKTIMLFVTGFCIFCTCINYFGQENVILSLLFLAVTLPTANLLAVIGLLVVIWYQKRTGRVWGKQKVEPYIGGVPQKPVDVVRPEPRRIEHRR